MVAWSNTVKYSICVYILQIHNWHAKERENWTQPHGPTNMVATSSVVFLSINPKWQWLVNMHYEGRQWSQPRSSGWPHCQDLEQSTQVKTGLYFQCHLQYGTTQSCEIQQIKITILAYLMHYHSSHHYKLANTWRWPTFTRRNQSELSHTAGAIDDSTINIVVVIFIIINIKYCLHSQHHMLPECILCG